MSTPLPPTHAEAPEGRRNILLRSTRVPATVQVIYLAVLVYFLATQRITLRQAMEVALAGMVIAVVAVWLVLCMRRQYGQVDQQQSAKDFEEAERMPRWHGAWHVLGSVRMPLVWVVVIYATTANTLISIKFPWFP